jgi:hypothetical protein
MPKRTPPPEEPPGLFTAVDDDQYDELVQLAGQRVVFAAVWEDSVADALDSLPGAASEPHGVDLDLYLQDGVYFELYATACYLDIDGEPVEDGQAVEQLLSVQIPRKLKLAEVAVDEDDGLVLVLAAANSAPFYLQAGAWLLSEWEELPDDTVL